MATASHPAEGLLRFERAVRSAQSLRELGFVAVNDAAAALEYEQAALWQPDAFGRPSLVAISGLAELDPNTPYALWLRRVLKVIDASRGAQPRVLRLSDLPERLAQEGADWMLGHALHCPLVAPNGAILGGLWLMRARAFDNAERARAEWIASAVAFAAWGWRGGAKHRFRRSLALRWKLLAAVLGLAGVGAMPVQLSVLAAAEVTPLAPIAVAAPVDGVIERVLVQPNQPVRRGDALLQVDDTTTRNRLAVARKGLDIARAELQRASSKAFADDASKAEIQLLEARARERAAEVDYLTELLGRLRVVAPQDGVAIFADAEQWRGKPVQTGERVMTIADPQRVGLTIYLAPSDALALEAGAPVKMYLNTAPLAALPASITQTSYEVTRSPEGPLAYVLKADLRGGEARIGLKGTAKLFGSPAPLAYHVLRRPLAQVRATMGI